MTNEQYAVLTDELRNDPLGVGYANLTNEQVAAVLNAKTRKKVVQRFVSLRAIANVLDDIEYGLFKQAITAAALVDAIPKGKIGLGDDGTIC